MALRISDIRTPVEEPEAGLPARIGKMLGLRDGFRHRILRKALDARDRHALEFVYTVEVTVGDDEAALARLARTRFKAELWAEEPFTLPPPGVEPLPHRPIVVGSGPAGLAAACLLAEQGYAPLLLERGKRVNERIRDVEAFDKGGPHDPESNYLFGEGGAGTFSDGKLTYRGSGPDVRWVLELLAACKGKPEIVYEARPHLGSNRLPAVVKALRRRVESLGGEVRFDCRVEDVEIDEGRVKGVSTSSGFIASPAVLLAIGHSARDTYEMLLRRGVPMEQKPFQMGVRIEQPQETVNRVHYGETRLEERLGAASYSLIANGKPDLFTFCMCAGGYVMPSVSEPGAFCTNGMSLSKHDSPYANSGLVVTADPREWGTDVLAGVRWQRRYEALAYEAGRRGYLCPIQRAGDFLRGKASEGVIPSSYPRGTVNVRLEEVIPRVVAQALHHGLPIMDRRWQGRFLAEASLVGPEARGSAPVRIVRDGATRESPGLRGLYPAGEGAGYAGGIVSAAVDGLRSARALMARFARLERR
ncbi:MAG: NAD(P)-binding protein [Gemmataceae bacterium]|nr:NAD(P)-binding protein [Gemmataceae bacterium]